VQVVTIELLNEKALALLKELEKLKILRLVSSNKPSELPKRQWSGSLSKQTGKEMLKQVQKSRDELERNI